MRWIIVFLFLYFIPLIVLFKNYNNIKRSFIYASTYITLVTTIVITNIYISGVNKIKQSMYYENYYFYEEYDEEYIVEKHINENENLKDTSEISKKEETELDSKNDDNNVVLENNKQESKEVINYSSEKSDKEIIYEFKKEIYEIEKKALIPMRECIPYTQNIVEALKQLDKVKEDLEYASNMCTEVTSIYETMDIPQLSNDDYTETLNNARNDVKTAYELREKAMESAITLINTKNPKYIGNVTEYLSLSDNCMNNFKERLVDLNQIIDK